MIATETRRQRNRWMSTVLIAAASFPIGPPAFAAESAKQPNILVIVADDLGYGDVGFNGCKDIPTPNIDGIAAAGVRCSNGYVSCPVCSPTRAGLLTSRYQERFGHEFNPGPIEDTEKAAEFGLPLTETTLANSLKSAGYSTGLVGKWHLGFDEKYRPQQRGFDEFFGFLGGAHQYFQRGKGKAAQAAPIYRGNTPVDESEYLTDAFTREAVAFLDRRQDKPFFLLLTYNAVHNPLQAPEKYLSRFSGISDEQRRTYAAMLSALNDGVGKVMETLRKKGLEENTLIFFISDNGGPTKGNGSNNGPLRGDKATVWEGGIRIPFLIQWKGKLPGGKVYDQPVISLDIGATAAAAAGAAHGGGKPIDGVNLLPFVLGEAKQPPHETLYWRFGQQHAIRQGNYKLLQRNKQPQELYDLAADPGEQHDLAGEKREIVDQLNKSYSVWNAELAAPLWRGQGGQKKQQKAKQASNSAQTGKS